MAAQVQERVQSVEVSQGKGRVARRLAAFTGGAMSRAVEYTGLVWFALMGDRRVALMEEAIRKAAWLAVMGERHRQPGGRQL